MVSCTFQRILIIFHYFSAFSKFLLKKGDLFRLCPQHFMPLPPLCTLCALHSKSLQTEKIQKVRWKDTENSIRVVKTAICEMSRITGILLGCLYHISGIILIKVGYFSELLKKKIKICNWACDLISIAMLVEKRFVKIFLRSENTNGHSIFPILCWN